MSRYSIDGIGPKIPADGSVWIAPGAHVIGDVRFGAGASVWFGAVIRGDNEPVLIGERTNVQDGAVLHSDPGAPLRIGANVTIGHRAVVHGCTILDGCLIGMGAIILNGARIGRHSIVGAGALVTEGKEFPDEVLVLGSPAKVVRRLDGRELNLIDRSAAGYVVNGARYLARLIPVN